MSILDRFLGNTNKKTKAISAFEEESSVNPDKETQKDESSSDAFLDLVGDLALRQKLKSSSYP